MRYQHDLPALQAQFAQLGEKGWQALIDADRIRNDEDDNANPVLKEAWRIFTKSYDLGDDDDDQGIPVQGARDYVAALHAGRVPEWVQDMALLDEIRKALREE